MEATGRTRNEDAERTGRGDGTASRPYGLARAPRNRDPREAGWVLPAASSGSQLALERIIYTVALTAIQSRAAPPAP